MNEFNHLITTYNAIVNFIKFILLTDKINNTMNRVFISLTMISNNL